MLARFRESWSPQGFLISLRRQFVRTCCNQAEQQMIDRRYRGPGTTELGLESSEKSVNVVSYWEAEVASNLTETLH